ncbi:hypothetical protein M430DRAFT_182766 [Amorphotheca resinae ATCC 22711]|uniref:Ubiquinol-cytochrome-c reductase complex assembly factor 2 n=1 Tax=Amorphotheca resinae ATCC 22711 TaxID=857342 RepID=A0A2T3ARU7_AMORE|nr:hypothetical protein M430DRAFT_182766 [Amorphotheca resinae ATCC 22711]PSS09087.1 hypothetical protein M430DRAFT_182766 [Amorphotheca resinae ATCC 22711]
MSTSLAYKHYLRALSRWPKDPLRPDCQFQDAMRHRIEQRLSPQKAAASPDAARAELEQVNALYSLLENRYSKKYALKGSLLTPASNPTHYTDLVRELDEAPKRNWWQQVTNKWKGLIRFK